jgi:hypothetical protein
MYKHEFSHFTQFKPYVSFQLHYDPGDDSASNFQSREYTFLKLFFSHVKQLPLMADTVKKEHPVFVLIMKCDY